MQSQITVKLTSNNTQEDSGSILIAKQELPALGGYQSLGGSPFMEVNEANFGSLCAHNDNVYGDNTTDTENDSTTVSTPSDAESSAELPEGISIAEKVIFFRCKNISMIPETVPLEIRDYKTCQIMQLL
eukprot:9751379-Ditylum_brightwellii.AAC.1